MGFENKLKTLHGKGRLKRKKIKPRNDDIHKATKCKKLKTLCSTQGDEVIVTTLIVSNPYINGVKKMIVE